ncbi:MAG: 1-acyl-sn-glycerol-3-phosphate acyltransferase [Chitinophagales bacterium]
MIAKLFLKLIGWKVQEVMPKGIDRCVMIASPHTSNWDFPIAKAAFVIMKIPLRFTVKDSLFKFPYNLIFGPLGGIPINRTPKKEGEERPSTVQAMANMFKENDKIAVMVTPEGTRSKRTEWKTGFYHVAKLAGVPIALGFLDYKKKLAGVGKVLYPSDDMEKDMREIMSFYKNITGKHPEKFSVDLRYV